LGAGPAQSQGCINDCWCGWEGEGGWLEPLFAKTLFALCPAFHFKRLTRELAMGLMVFARWAVVFSGRRGSFQLQSAVREM
jgi:hypothetical protein